MVTQLCPPDWLTSYLAVSCWEPTLSWGYGSGDCWAISWLCQVL